MQVALAVADIGLRHIFGEFHVYNLSFWQGLKEILMVSADDSFFFFTLFTSGLYTTARQLLRSAVPRCS